MTNRDARLDRLLDTQDILDCLTRFSRGMDRFDRELFLSAFHEDATIAAGPFVGSPGDCYDWAVPMHDAGQVATHHNLLNHSCEIEGDTAYSEIYYLFVGRNRDETNWMAGGRYVDRFERRDGAWRIAFRTNAIEWSGTVPTMPIPFADVPDIDANGSASRDRGDISYQRPLINRRAPRGDMYGGAPAVPPVPARGLRRCGNDRDLSHKGSLSGEARAPATVNLRRRQSREAFPTGPGLRRGSDNPV